MAEAEGLDLLPRVQVHVAVNSNGSVAEVRYEPYQRSSWFRGLLEAAARRCPWTPAREEGRAVGGWAHLWLHLPSAGPEPTPVPPGARLVEPHPADLGCVAREYREPEDAQGLYARVEARFIVDEAGRLSRFSSSLQAGNWKGLHNPASAVEGALWRAVRSCQWIPGAVDGRPAVMWLWFTIQVRSKPLRVYRMN